MIPAKLLCWWFGCEPDYIARAYNHDATPCTRCGAHDVSYSDMVGDTRHHRFVEALSFWKRWLPARCGDCHKRFGDHSKCDDIPF